MTVLAFDIHDKFTIRVVKHHSSNPDRKWANAYEFEATEAGTEANLLALGTAVAEFEAAMAKDFVIYDRILISTWEPDSVPYNPATFISSTLTLEGAVGPTASEPVALNVTMAVARMAGSGRFGHLFYRATLTEEDVSSPAGTSILADRTAKQTALDAALTSSGLSSYVGTIPDEGLRMVLVNKDGTQVRPVTQLRVQGVTTLPMDHAWFNRTPPTP